MNLYTLVGAHAADPDAIDRVALVQLDRAATPRSVTFGELLSLVDAAADTLAAAGVVVGDHVLVVLTPGIDLYVAVFATIAVGAVAVFVDSQSSRRAQLAAMSAARPVAVIAPAKLLAASAVIPALRRCRLRVVAESADTVAGRSGGSRRGTITWAEFVRSGSTRRRHRVVERTDADLAFVTFTSGSTGRPKGVPRTHGLIRRQHEALQANFPVSVTERVLVGFPMLGLHTLSVGCTAVLVALHQEPTAAELAAAMAEHGVNSAALSPALWSEVVAASADVDLSALHYVGSGGAPLSLTVARALLDRFPAAEAYCAYGSSESEPVARIELGSFERQATAVGEDRDLPGGYPVGRPVPEVSVRCVAVGSLDAAGTAVGSVDSGSLTVATGQVGELLVAGPNVIDRYLGDDAATRRTKVHDLNGTVWHRLEDLGWIDADGCLWLVGRLADRIDLGERGSLDPYPVELAVDQLAGVLRSAVIAHRARPGGELVVHELTGHTVDPLAVAAVLSDHGLDLPIVRAPIPLDRRIRSKIDRPTLRHRREALLAPTVSERLVHRWATVRSRLGRGAT